MLKGNGLKVLSYWNLNEDVFIFFIIAILLKVLSYWNLNFINLFAIKVEPGT